MIWVVFGGQYGSEGKGAFCAYLARAYGFTAAVRGGGPQAGHTFYDERFGGKCVVRQVPVGCVVNRTCIGYIGPGAVVDLHVLQAEIERYELYGKVWVHPKATVLLSDHKQDEEVLSARGLLPGSTKEGVGAARASRALRAAQTLEHYFPPEWPTTKAYMDRDLEVYAKILAWSSGNGRVMLEGAQGFWLSNFHGTYPYVTSADTTPAAALSEAGLSVQGVERIIAVLRTFPIRVGGPSGPFDSHEMKWSDLGVEAERTTVTGRERRIAEFEWAKFHYMMKVAQPSHAALMFCDYLDPEIQVKPLPDVPKVQEFWSRINACVPCPWIGVGTERFEVRGAMTGVVAGQTELRERQEREVRGE